MSPSPSNEFAKECNSKRIESVTLYKPKFIPSKNGSKRHIKAFHFIFLFLYIYMGYWCFSTMGEPYRKFLLKADREGFQVMEGTTKMRAQLEYALSDINNPDRRQTDKVGWFDFLSMDIEEHAEAKKKSKEQSVLDSLPKHMRVPKKYMAEFIPMLLTGICIMIHLLIVLMQHWSVMFNVNLNYRAVDADSLKIPDGLLDIPTEEDYNDDHDHHISGGGSSGKSPNGSSLLSAANGGTKGGDSRKKTLGERIYEKAEHTIVPSYLPTHAVVIPANNEKPVLVTLLYLPTLGLTFTYHRRRYVFNNATSTWTKIRCQTTMDTTFFSSWDGFTNPDQITASQVRFGQNIFEVKQPTFGDLYKAQLLSPFTVFQLFCVVLWMLDDYWQYSMFNLFMILMFEATVVFSRIKSLGALKGMGSKPRPVWVYRMEDWVEVESCDVLPGDIVSLTRHTPHFAKKEDSSGKGSGKKALLRPTLSKEYEDGDVVPADLLMLKGSAVVNEASLTGESVPQMKEGMSEVVEGENLSMKTQHKAHVLYAGTKMLQCKGVDVIDAEEEDEENDREDEDDKEDDDEEIDVSGKLYSSIPRPPDGGAICFVLRTGFLSAQGKLVRMIEGSQEKVKGHERETALLLLLLFFFAVASSGYVLYHGLRNEKRSQYELLLHCILIITSVIPPELPMQMALAVQNSLMTLMKMQVFCTEPYRVPIAGKLNACLFDKTGTLTTDELVAVGVCENKNLITKAKKGGKQSGDDASLLTPMTKTTGEAGLVLAGCHSLVLIEGEVTGDPLESASLKAMLWGIDKDTGRATPLPSTEKKQGGKEIQMPRTPDLPSCRITQLEVLARHHFSSKLQRMSCVVKDTKNKRVYAVAKGSPEAIGKLLATKPAGYDNTAKALAKRGFRVISLGYKPLLDNEKIESAKDSRAPCEEGITFAGFIAFTCRVRKDTKAVLARLTEGGMSVAMVTGDALLTAAHVAKEVGICDDDKDEDDILESEIMERNDELRKMLLEKAKKKAAKKGGLKKKKKEILLLEQNKAGILFWQNYDDDSHFEDFNPSNVPKLANNYDLATTGKNLQAAFDFDEGTKKVLGYFKIFARMTPDAKETVIECLHSVGQLCLMCGDGANDVGALKQADVGVALLTGFGDVNVDKGEDTVKKTDKKKTPDIPISAIMTEDQIQAMRMVPVAIIKAKIRQLGVDPNKYPEIVEKEDLIKLYQIKAREKAVQEHDKKNALAKNKNNRAELMAEKQAKIQVRIKELEAQGEQWAQFKAMKEFWAEEIAEGKKKKADLAKMGGVEGQAANLTAQLEGLELEEIPMVKLGDASIAAPFTSKMPSIRSCVDIVRQGRCTLVTSMQMYQILALNCMISSYSLSVLYLDGVKYGDVQMTAMGMLMTVSFTTVSRSKPLDKLSSVQPLTSIFHPSSFISLLGQFAVHFFIMMVAVRAAKEHLPPDYEPDLDGEFHPGILNSVVFLVSNVQQVTVFVVNLQGHPFMTGLTQNRPLLWSLIATFILTFMFASESVPSLNKYFQLVPFPGEDFRDYILKLLAADVFFTFAIDRLMKLIFAPQILFASVKGTTMKDVIGLAKTCFMILIIMQLFLGNDEQWQEMLEEEAREAALLEAEESVLNASEVMLDATLNN
eukprot:CAMPEP_0203668656 /NCGR_PEP_ID=MMETSP0090-20130426/5232_1 /ASSEMBLY_ACC=CAM_ASM_001088 /TAXON_ID=426623 /ORGANISM="Chaetoceros affinis, Strain CCMP159" /LENGTH=1630 /DNA_ID=CAMNT_0050533151 /DNA_START=285 /DNA_END=5174 /DNA_ORIENTATION=+